MSRAGKGFLALVNCSVNFSTYNNSLLVLLHKSPYYCRCFVFLPACVVNLLILQILLF